MGKDTLTAHWAAHQEFATVLKETAVGAGLFVAFAFVLCSLGWLWTALISL